MRRPDQFSRNADREFVAAGKRFDHHVDRHVEQFGQHLEQQIGRFVAFLWEYRIELIYVGLVVGTYVALFFVLYHDPIVAAVGWGFVGIVLWRQTAIRHAVTRPLNAARVRRRWDRAIHHCGFIHRVPARRVRRLADGYQLRVHVGHGISFDDLNRKAEALAATLNVREVRARRDQLKAGRGTVMLIQGDYLAHAASSPWPNATFNSRWRDIPRRQVEVDPSNEVSVWEPIPVGLDEYGHTVTISLPERNLLIGGTPGAGKSVAISMLIATGALDPTVHLWLIDGKYVEFADWEPLADGFAHNMAAAIQLLRRMQLVIERRFRDELPKAKKKKIDPDSNLGLHLVFIDELALFTSSTDTRASKEFTTLLTDLVARGRAAGVIVIAATQKPEGTIVSTNLRDLFAYRWAMRCGTPEASDTILGRGWASQGFNAARIAPNEPGMGYLLAEDGLPIRHRAFHIQDHDVRALAQRALERRGLAPVGNS